MNKQPEVTEKTKKKFIDAFCKLYEQKPIEKITVQEITRMTGYNRSTFYQYFTDIYDLLGYLENDILSYLEHMSESDLNGEKKVDSLRLHQIAQLFDEKGNYLNVLLGDYGSVRFINKLKKALPNQLSETQCMIDGNIKLLYIQEFCFFGMISLFRYWQKKGQQISSEELVKLIYTLLLDGIKSQEEAQILLKINE